MSAVTSGFYGDAGRRGALGLGIVVAHIGLIVLIARSIVAREPVTTAAPVVVTFVQESVRQLESPKLSDPALTRIQPVLNTPPPELELATEPPDTLMTATSMESPPPPPAGPPSSAGSDVPSMSDVAYLKQPAPRYPPDSRRAREEGLVILRVLIDEAGHAKSVDVYRSSGHPRLDEAARNAVARALFKPFIDGGVARVAFAMIPIEFSLHATSS
jgi:protein TonB